MRARADGPRRRRPSARTVRGRAARLARESDAFGRALRKIDRFFDAHPVVNFGSQVVATAFALTVVFYLSVWTGAYQRTVAKYVEPMFARAVPFWMRTAQPMMDRAGEALRRRLGVEARRA